MEKKLIIRKKIWKITREVFLIILGILSAGFGLKGFLIPNGFIDGGVTGISLLLTLLTSFSLPAIIFVINLPFMLLARKQVSTTFAIKTFLAILGLSLCLFLIKYPIVTSDKLLVSLFGGLFLGAGIGLSVRGGAVIDGTEVLALYLSRKISATIGDVILIINIIIFSLAAILLSIEVALYSLLTYLSASKTVDFIVEGIEEYIGITIISEKNELIRKKIISECGKGVTVYKGKKGLGKGLVGSKDIDVLFTVVTRLEVSKIKHEISIIDPSAFIIEQRVKDAKGGFLKKRPLHEGE